MAHRSASGEALEPKCAQPIGSANMSPCAVATPAVL